MTIKTPSGASPDASPEIQARQLEQAALEQLQAGLGKLDEAIARTPGERRKGALRGRRFSIERRLQAVFPWYSQAGQDRWIDQTVYRGKRGGSFVEVGAYDGITGSNTLFFEQFRDWRGFLVEPSPHWAGVARTMRSCPCLEVAAGGAAGRASFMEVTRGYTQMGGLVESYDDGLRDQVTADPRFEGRRVEVMVRPLGDILAEQGMRRIDYLSLDVEGAEVDVLEAFPFDGFEIGVWSIENNTGRGEIGEIMRRAGYERALCIGVDEIWCRPGLLAR